jgi:hypothetical protein
MLSASSRDSQRNHDDREMRALSQPMRECRPGPSRKHNSLTVRAKARLFVLAKNRFYTLALAFFFAGLSTFIPPRYGTSTSGTVTVPSGFW